MALPKQYRLEVKGDRSRPGFKDIIVARRDTPPGDPAGYEAVVRIEDGTVTCNNHPDDPVLAEAVEAAIHFAQRSS